MLDNYSGPSSCLWGLRSLVIAFLQGPKAGCWRASHGRLPIEDGDYDIPFGPTTLVGDARTGDIRLKIGSNKRRMEPLEEYWWGRKLASKLLWRPFRPDNHAAKYDSEYYSSLTPFCGCSGAKSQPGLPVGS